MLFQQPEGDTKPDVPVIGGPNAACGAKSGVPAMPTLGNGDVVVGLGAVHGEVMPDAPARPVLSDGNTTLDVPVIVVSNGAETVGIGTVTIGLVPGSPSSVEPSGIAPPPSDDPAAIPEVENVGEMELPDIEPQSIGIAKVPDPITMLAPPPSNTELDPAIPELVFPITGHVVPSGAGLKPPTSSSVAPN